MTLFSKECNVPVSFTLAEKLYKIGYVVGTQRCITRYDSDFVYDGDPEHPESHKAGEIHMYDFWHKNNEDEKNLFECPSVEELVSWLLEVHNIYLNAVPEYDCKYGVRWCHEIIHLYQNRITKSHTGHFPSRLEALMNGANKAVDDLLKCEKAENPCPEQFF